MGLMAWFLRCYWGWGPKVRKVKKVNGLWAIKKSWNFHHRFFPYWQLILKYHSRIRVKDLDVIYVRIKVISPSSLMFKILFKKELFIYHTNIVVNWTYAEIPLVNIEIKLIYPTSYSWMSMTLFSLSPYWWYRASASDRQSNMYFFMLGLAKISLRHCTTSDFSSFRQSNI